nr:D-tagatose-bisphosphate aldolase, class II, non-catalytic subunit [uncultured Cohaesibacter sp.]
MKDIIKRHLSGEHVGICSVCSAHPAVIEAALRFDLNSDRIVLIEATSNQVNQFGGYTGMRPKDFRDFVFKIADDVGFPRKRICLGGDHLGPNAWQKDDPETAMAKSRQLVADYVAAGFTKIHLDASMAVAGETNPIAPEVAAARAADMAVAAEKAVGDGEGPVYIIGTEVPVPGGETDGFSGIKITDPADVKVTIETHRQAFAKRGLEAAFERVVGVVVQPGVDFDHSGTIAYDPQKAEPLTQFIEGCSGLVYEAHSTDYQTPEALRGLVAGHFAILKVGPALTFAMREGLYALVALEDELIPVEKRSQLRAVLERIMLDEPKNWAPYYKGDASTQKLLRSYSQSDRIRYYWAQPEVVAAVDKLYANINSVTPIPAILSEYMGYELHRAKGAEFNARGWVVDKIMQVLEDYAFAAEPNPQRLAG